MPIRKIFRIKSDINHYTDFLKFGEIKIEIHIPISQNLAKNHYTEFFKIQNLAKIKKHNYYIDFLKFRIKSNTNHYEI